MMIITAVQEAQLPLLSAVLLGGSAAKFARTARTAAGEGGLGATALLPARLRLPAVAGIAAIECLLGLGIIATAGQVGSGPPATGFRLGCTVFFLVATCALIELRNSRPDIGCGCFGDFSVTPVNGRVVARSALLALAALATIWLPALRIPRPGPALALALATIAAELTLLGVLSPELGEALVRLGYSEPCELQAVPAERTLAVLRRSKQWRKRAVVRTSDDPADVWRELCWRYVVYPARYEGREAELVFAVYLRHRHPPIHAALVDSATGRTLSWPQPPARSRLLLPGVLPRVLPRIALRPLPLASQGPRLALAVPHAALPAAPAVPLAAPAQGDSAAGLQPGLAPSAAPRPGDPAVPQLDRPAGPPPGPPAAGVRAAAGASGPTAPWGPLDADSQPDSIPDAEPVPVPETLRPAADAPYPDPDAPYPDPDAPYPDPTAVAAEPSTPAGATTDDRPTPAATSPDEAATAPLYGIVVPPQADGAPQLAQLPGSSPGQQLATVRAGARGRSVPAVQSAGLPAMRATLVPAPTQADLVAAPLSARVQRSLRAAIRSRLWRFLTLSSFRERKRKIAR